MSSRTNLPKTPKVPKTCSLHKVHHPPALTVEDHHIVPQAWQHYYQTPTGEFDPLYGTKVNGQWLWDGRVVTLCPTGHRNVHFWIVALMRANTTFTSTLIPNDKEHVKSLAKAVLATGRHRTAELPIAMLALRRFLAAGGNLTTLAAVGLLGEA